MDQGDLVEWIWMIFSHNSLVVEVVPLVEEVVMEEDSTLNLIKEVVEEEGKEEVIMDIMNIMTNNNNILSHSLKTQM